MKFTDLSDDDVRTNEDDIRNALMSVDWTEHGFESTPEVMRVKHLGGSDVQIDFVMESITGYNIGSGEITIDGFECGDFGGVLEEAGIEDEVDPYY